MAFEEKEDSIEKLDLQVWKRIFKLIFTDKKTIILLISFVILMGLIDTFYPSLSIAGHRINLCGSPDVRTW